MLANFAVDVRELIAYSAVFTEGWAELVQWTETNEF